MHIGIDANPIVGPRAGVGWHTYFLLHSLLELADGHTLTGYLRPGSLRHMDLVGWSFGDRLQWVESSKLWMRWRGRWDRLDLYHGTNFRVQTEGRHGAVVTIHDVWLDRQPQYSKKVFGQTGSYRRTRRLTRQVRRIITVSQFSAREISEVYGVPLDCITVIYNGVSSDFYPLEDLAAMDALRARLDISAAGFILFVGGADPRKNHTAFLHAIHHARSHLKGKSVVLVGSPQHRYGNFLDTAQRFSLQPHVVCPGRLSGAELRLLYSYADVFVFPSLYEGFGMPVLEAMACGAPTVTSRTSALPEVAGDAAVLVNPEDPEELGNAIVHVLTDEHLRWTLRQKGLARVRLFTWKQAAEQTMALYHQLCS